MGLVISGLNKRKGASVKNVIVDGGSSVCTDDYRLTKSASINASNSTNNDTGKSQSKTKQPSSYDVACVSGLITARKLAPFYEGVEDLAKDPEVSNTETETEHNADVNGTGKEIMSIVNNNPVGTVPQSTTPAVTAVSTEKARRGCFMIRLFKKKRQQRQSSGDSTSSSPDNTQLSTVNPEWLSTNLVECPICCLAYPLNTNWTACCSQPMCTFCFLHLRFPPSGREITCPFCNGMEFGVRYYEPRVIEEHGLTEKLLRGETEDNDVLSGKGSLVKSETVRIKPVIINSRPRHHPRQYSHNRLGSYTASSSGYYYHQRQTSYINAAHDPWYLTPIGTSSDGTYMNTRPYGASPWFAFP